MMDNYVIEFRDGHKKFGKNIVLKNLNYGVRPNEFFVLFGPSGAGKTTTLKIIAGLEMLSYGKLLLGGKIANYIPPQARDVRMAFENYSLYPHLTVYDNIASPLKAKKMDKGEMNNRIEYITKMLAINEYTKRFPRELSGGQKQRVALARALVMDSKYYLLDEPLAHLDAKIRNELRAEFQNIKSFLSNATVVYVTHDYLESLSLGDRIAVMKEGEIVQIGKPEDVYDNPANIFAATMMGQPEINLFDMNIVRKDGQVKLVNQDISIYLDDIRAGIISNHSSDKLILGIRPLYWEFMQNKPNNEVDFLKGEINGYEVRNYKGVIFCKVKNREIVVLCEAHQHIDVKEPVWLKPRQERFLFFDNETGLNIIKGAN